MARPRSEHPTFSLAKRGDWYYVQFWRDGRCCRVATKSLALPEAETFMRQFAANYDPARWALAMRPGRPAHADRRNVATIRPVMDRITLLSEAQIADRADLAPDTCGVYFLLKDQKVVYVGQALNVLSRIGDHVATKDFDEWTWIPVALDMLNATETAYIRHFNPPLNNDSATVVRRRRLVGQVTTEM